MRGAWYNILMRSPSVGAHSHPKPQTSEPSHPAARWFFPRRLEAGPDHEFRPSASWVDTFGRTGRTQVVIRAHRAMEYGRHDVVSERCTDGMRKDSLKTPVPHPDDRVHFASVANETQMNRLVVSLDFDTFLFDH